MRITYWRRLFFSLFILSILSMCLLVLNTIVHNKQGNFISYSYDIQTNCSDVSQISSNQYSTVPPHYLVIPYREFALRTSISCRVFRLDNPGKNQNKFHPKYSKYLRGSFPFVIPHTNITFDDIENFYTKILVNKTDTNSSIQTSFASNITFEYIPYKFQDGMWYPIGVISAQRTAILVPLQGREYNAKAFLFNMHAFFRRQQLTYTIILVEQIVPADQKFNKGRLYNTAIKYIEKQNLNITCIVLHDVDLLPEDDGNFYTCESKNIKHTTSRVRQLDNLGRGYTKYYEFLIGGVLLLSLDMYKSLNGFSNLYWGWGGEDDDLALRLIQKRMCVVRPSYELAIYAGLPHPRGPKNNARYSILTWATLRLGVDGYAQIESLTKIISEHQTPIVTHLKLDVDATGSLNKRSSINKPTTISIKSNNAHLSSMNKTHLKLTRLKQS